MHPKIILPIAILCLLFALPAFAGDFSNDTTESVLQEMTTLANQSPCSQTTEGKNKCFGDLTKKIGKLRQRYNSAEARAHDAWHQANDAEGISDAWTKKHKKLHAGMQAAHKHVDALFLQMRKVQGDAQKAILKQGSATISGFSKTLTGEEAKKALEECRVDKHTKDERVCLRTKLGTTTDPLAIKRKLPKLVPTKAE